MCIQLLQYCYNFFISQAQPNEIEAKLDNGLIKGHAYSVTDVRLVSTSEHNLVAKIWGLM